jgi:ABC-type dipeptide/oligopeptide/nickel transport system permease subunit
VANIAVGQGAFLGDNELPAKASGIGAMLRRAATLSRQNPLGAASLVIILVFVVMAVFAAAITPYSPTEFAGSKNETMSGSHLFGTEVLGRDIFTRTVYGAQISLSVAVISVMIGGAIGILLGITSGYMGGFIDSSFQRSVDALIAFPPLLLLLIITQALGPSYRTIVIALMLAVIPGTLRIVRGAVLSEKNNQYIEAARASGAWTPRIILRHILPNIVALGIIVMTTLLGGIILAESSLSFLGLGIPGVTSWGQDVSRARDSFPQHVPAAFFPGAAITLTVLAFNLLGDSLRDILDPRLRGSR